MISVQRLDLLDDFITVCNETKVKWCEIQDR